jgi:hypothetical protein
LAAPPHNDDEAYVSDVQDRPFPDGATKRQSDRKHAFPSSTRYGPDCARKLP